MAYQKFQKKERNYVSDVSTRENVRSVLQYPIANPTERGIRKEICEKFGIRMAVSQEDGKTPIAYYFPYFDKSGKLTGFKRRDLSKEKYDAAHFTTIGKVGVDCLLFGQQVSLKIERPHKQVVLVEGEWDVLSAYQAMVDSVANTKYAGMEPFVVGLSCGTGNAVDAVLSNSQFVCSFEKIVLGFDADAATTPAEKVKGIKKGKEATEDVAAALMQDNIHIVQYSDDMKDPSDYLQNNRSAELAKLLQFGSQKFVAEKIITSSQMALEDVIAKREEGVYVKCFPKLMRKLHGFRKRELVVITGPSGVGKSTITTSVAYDLAEAGNRVGFIYLEETERETLQRMMAHHLKVEYNSFKDDPRKHVSEEKLAEAKQWCDEDDRFVFLSHFGSIRIEDLMNKVKTLVYINKVDFILLDHLSMCVSGLKEADERKLLDMIMTELAAFCAANDVGIIAVSHINRTASSEFRAPKGKETEPFWVEITKEMMRGSAALEQLAWVVLGLEPEIMPDRTRGRVRLTVLKNRPWGYLGQADVLKMNETTGQLEDASFEQF